MSSLNVDAVQSGWTKYDFLKLAERTPIISTVISVATLVFQMTSSLSEGPSDYSFSHYAYETPEIRSATLLLPVLGNIVVILYDLINEKYDDQEHMLEEIKVDAAKAYDASPRLLNDLSFLFRACSVQPKLLDLEFSSKLRGNRDWMLKFVTNHPEYTSKANRSLFKDKAYVEKALEVGTDPYISNHIGYPFLEDRDIITKAVKRADPLIIDKIQGELRDDLEFQRELVRINPEAYLEADGKRWSTSMEGLKEILKTNPKAVAGREREISSARTYALPILEDAEIVEEIFMNEEVEEDVREKVLSNYLSRHQSTAPKKIIDMTIEHARDITYCYSYLVSHPEVQDNVELAIKAVKRDPECFELGYTCRHYQEVQEALKEHFPEYYKENKIAEKYPVSSNAYGNPTAAAKVDDKLMDQFKQKLSEYGVENL